MILGIFEDLCMNKVSLLMFLGPSIFLSSCRPVFDMSSATSEDSTSEPSSSTSTSIDSSSTSSSDSSIVPPTLLEMVDPIVNGNNYKVKIKGMDEVTYLFNDDIMKVMDHSHGNNVYYQYIDKDKHATLLSNYSPGGYLVPQASTYIEKDTSFTFDRFYQIMMNYGDDILGTLFSIDEASFTKVENKYSYPSIDVSISKDRVRSIYGIIEDDKPYNTEEELIVTLKDLYVIIEDEVPTSFGFKEPYSYYDDTTGYVVIDNESYNDVDILIYDIGTTTSFEIKQDLVFTTLSSDSPIDYSEVSTETLSYYSELYATLYPLTNSYELYILDSYTSIGTYEIASDYSELTFNQTKKILPTKEEVIEEASFSYIGIDDIYFAIELDIGSIYACYVTSDVAPIQNVRYSYSSYKVNIDEGATESDIELINTKLEELLPTYSHDAYDLSNYHKATIYGYSESPIEGEYMIMDLSYISIYEGTTPYLDANMYYDKIIYQYTPDESDRVHIDFIYIPVEA